MNHITDQFYGVTKGKEKTFVNGFHQIFHSINNTKKGIYCSDNLLTWGRNLSFMKNERLMKIFNKFSKGQYPLHGILWRIATIVWAAEIGLKLDGDFVECGCYKGTTAKVVHEYLEFSKINKFEFPYLIDQTQEVARKYSAVCTPDFFGYNSKLELQYRGRIRELKDLKPVDIGDSDLLNAMRLIVKTGKGPKNQIPSAGCSIKWKTN